MKLIPETQIAKAYLKNAIMQEGSMAKAERQKHELKCYVEVEGSG